MSKTRIKTEVRNRLAVLSGARCSMCNTYLLEDILTRKPSELREHAHIIGDSIDGPRGKSYALNKESVDNIILLCPTCHKIVDSDTKTYSVEFLRKMKSDHENRIKYLTSLALTKRTLPMIFHSKLVDKSIYYDQRQIYEAILDDGLYPDGDPGIEIIFNNSTIDNMRIYYDEARREIDEYFFRFQKRISENHISLFALAPQPLLIYLGTKLQNISNVVVKQRSRVTSSWCWENPNDTIDFIIKKPSQINIDKNIALVFSISDTVDSSRIFDVLPNCDIWTITVDKPNMNIIKSKKMVNEFSRVIIEILAEIKKNYGINKPIHIFPIMPISLAVTAGRVWMPKANNALIIYEQNYKGDIKGFIEVMIIQ